jgi:hypothetical protein
MKRIAFLAFSAVLFISGISAFAFGRGPDMPAVGDNQDRSVTSVQQQTVVALAGVTPAQEWVGKTVVQLVGQLGKPDFTSAPDSSDRIYVDYNQHGRNETAVTTQSEFSGRKVIYGYDLRGVQSGRNETTVITQVEFDIASNGNIMSAKVSTLS